MVEDGTATVTTVGAKVGRKRVYADCGLAWIMGPLFQTPAEAAREAVVEKTTFHVVGVSSLAAGHKGRWFRRKLWQETEDSGT